MKKLLLLSIILLLFPLVRAEISMTVALNDKYNIGDPITASFLLETDNLERIFKAVINCDGTILEYYTNSIKSSKETIETALPKIAPSMKGQCSINAKLIGLDNSILEE